MVRTCCVLLGCAPFDLRPVLHGLFSRSAIRNFTIHSTTSLLTWLVEIFFVTCGFLSIIFFSHIHVARVDIFVAYYVARLDIFVAYYVARLDIFVAATILSWQDQVAR